MCVERRESDKRGSQRASVQCREQFFCSSGVPTSNHARGPGTIEHARPLVDKNGRWTFTCCLPYLFIKYYKFILANLIEEYN